MPFFGLFAGTRLRRSPVADTVGHCPSCGVDRRLKRVRVANYVHVYWLPVWKLSDLGEALVCASCGEERPADGERYRVR